MNLATSSSDNPFCPWTVTLGGAPTGPLQGLSFAAKDNFDIAGHITGNGNPDYLATHTPAIQTAPVIQKLLDAGAHLAGKTIMDELALSLFGINIHYGTPLNPAAPDRIPGGSSSGSASAVAQGLVDFALGSDTGGSVRVPASHCGLYALRPTHGLINATGLAPLSPSLDTVGWFARDAATLLQVGKLLLPPVSHTFRRLLIVDDAFDHINQGEAAALKAVIPTFAKTETTRLCDEGFETWLTRYRSIQGYENWQVNGPWIEATKPHFAPPIQKGFQMAAKVTKVQYEEAFAARQVIAERITSYLDEETLLCVPSALGIAPLKNALDAELTPFRGRELALGCISGFPGLPQITLPLATHQGCPIGLSFIGPAGSDLSLLTTASQIPPSALVGDLSPA